MYVLTAVVLGSVIPSIALAQPARVRTLTYDADKKDWVELPPPPPGTPEGDLHLIRIHIKDGHFREALKLAERFDKRHGSAHELYPAVLLAKAQALIGRRDYDKAHGVLQAFLGEYAGIAQTPEALRLEFVIAEAYLGGAKRKLWGLAILSGEDVALRILDEISTDYPDGKEAEWAVKTKADYLFRTGQHGLAEDEYARLIRDFPRSQYYRYAWRRAADASLASFGGVEFDEAALIEAQERFREYQGRFPSDAGQEDVQAILDRIHQLRGEKEYSIADYYERTDHLTSAVFHYRLVRKDYPETIAARRAAARLEALGAVEPEDSGLPSSTGDTENGS